MKPHLTCCSLVQRTSQRRPCSHTLIHSHKLINTVVFFFQGFDICLPDLIKFIPTQQLKKAKHMFTLEIIGCMLLFCCLTFHIISLLTAVDGTPFPFREALLQGALKTSRE